MTAENDARTPAGFRQGDLSPVISPRAERQIATSEAATPGDFPSLQAWPVEERLAWVARFRALVARNEKTLCELIEADTGKPRIEALTGDVAPLLAACVWLERNAPRVLKERRIGGAPFWMRGVKARVRREPLGRVAIIATWNYPAQLLGIQLAHALAAGNCVTVKPSERSPRSQEYLLGLARRAGADEARLAWTGATREAGETLLASQRFDHVVFTGSTAVGKLIAQRLAPSLTPATLELSGRDSALVFDDADPKLAAHCLFAALSLNAGQTCMGPRRALVHASVYEAFAQHLTELARNATARLLIDEAEARRCHELAVAACAAGGVDAAGQPSPPTGRVLRPTVIMNCPASCAASEGRHFGPLLAVVRCNDFVEMLRLHKAAGQHLVTSVFTKDPRRAERLAHRLGSTTVTINDIVLPTAHPGVGLGGRGESGVGVSRGEEGLLALTRPVYITRSNGLVRQAGKKYGRFMIEGLARMLRWWYRAGSAEAVPAGGPVATLLPQPVATPGRAPRETGAAAEQGTEDPDRRPTPTLGA